MDNKKILLVRLSALGDVVQTLSALAYLRARTPQATVGWLVDARFASLLVAHPDITHLHTVPWRHWQRMFLHPWRWPALLREAWRLRQEIVAVGYDVGVDLQGLFKSALLLWWSGLRQRVGFAHQRESSQWFYTRRAVSRAQYFDPALPHIGHMNRLVDVAVLDGDEKILEALPGDSAPLLLPPRRLAIPEANQEAVHRVCRRHFGQAPGDAGFRLALLSPGTAWASKHWPVGHWQQLALRLTAPEAGYHIVILGTSAEAPLAEEIAAGLPPDVRARCLCLAGQTSIEELLAWLPDADVFIGPDSAPLHMAALMKTPRIIGLYGPTSSTRTQPLGDQMAAVVALEAAPGLPCQPCHARRCHLLPASQPGPAPCLAAVSVDAVLGALCLQEH